MAVLIQFEFYKVWKKKSFLALMALLILLNGFLLWYLNQPSGDESPLSAYKAVCRDISDMTEPEKRSYISSLKDQMDTLTLKDELWKEISAVYGYEDYLTSVQEKSLQLSGISIFQSQTSEKNFGSRNIEKSAADHKYLSSENIRWYPAKGTSVAVENQVTDLLLLLSVFLFVGQLITEEKRKGLFAITRASRHGICADMGARILALLLHCIIIGFFLYSTNLLYAHNAAGLGDLSASLQSLQPYMESSMDISLGMFLIFVFLTKTGVVFLMGLLLTACAIYSKYSFFPQLAGLGFLGVNWLLYTLAPPYSGWNLLKYLSYFGLLRADELYGTYVNLNVFGIPVHRMNCSLILLAVLTLIGIAAVFLLFRYGSCLTLQQTRRFRLTFHPHSSLFRHEGQKILIANRGLVILLVFVLLLGWNTCGKNYTPSAGEEYYQKTMFSLEGQLTEEKEAWIQAEQEHYDEALAQIERIEQMIADGTMDENTGEYMKIPWYNDLAFYPWFQRILAQYEQILSNGGAFIYDTGYLYLFGQMDDTFLSDLLLLSLCTGFLFANVMAMEDSKKLWGLLSATQYGKKRIIRTKWYVCSVISAGISILPWLFRIPVISAVYPMGEIFSNIQGIPQYQEFFLPMPILLFILLSILSQVIAVWLLCSAVLLFSMWRKSYFQTLFLVLLLFGAPLMLAAMGMDIMKWFSVWPIYSWTGLF